jgi:ATP-dependent DNA helicase PIF1
MCDGTRLIVTKLGKYVIEGKVISGSNIGENVFIPRLSLTPSDKRLPFKFQRRQFPITVSFAMTINKSQGQSLKYVGVYLPQPIFSHGQLYVALSRVTSREGLKILITDNENEPSNITQNVVYKEVFRNVKEFYFNLTFMYVSMYFLYDRYFVDLLIIMHNMCCNEWYLPENLYNRLTKN